MKVGKVDVYLDDLTNAIFNYGRILGEEYDFSLNDESACRLQVTDSSWFFHTGDSQYDTDHRGYWGIGSVPTYCTKSQAREIARALINEAADDAAIILQIRSLVLGVS